VKYYDWSDSKNAKLKAERGICFPDIVAAINQKGALADIDHPNVVLYPGQRVLLVEIDNYVYVVPYVEDKTKIFFKTIYASRKMTKKYVAERRNT